MGDAKENSEEKTETSSTVKDSEEKTGTLVVKDSEEKNEETSTVNDSEEKPEITFSVKDSEEKNEETSTVKDSEEKPEITFSVKDSEEKNEATSSVNDSHTPKSSASVKVIKKKKAAGFQAPKKAPSMNNGDTVGKTKPQKGKEKEIEGSTDQVEQGLNDAVKIDKNEKSEKKKKPKKSKETKESVKSKEVKPKKTKKSIKKESNDSDKENDAVKPKITKKSSVVCGTHGLHTDDIVQTSECNKDDNTTKNKETLKKTKKKENAGEPAKSLSEEEWEQVFQSAIDRVMNTSLDQLLPTDEELVQNTNTQNEDENEDVVLEDSSQNAGGLKVDIPNEKLEIEGAEQIHENSRNHDFPLENENIQMVECAQVQELNENTPEGSELEFNGEEEKKHQHTPVVLVKKAMKKADRNSAAKVLAPRQLHFPKPSENTEKQKKKDFKEIKKGKKKVMDVMNKKKETEKKTELTENVNDTTKDQPGRSKKQLMMEREIQETGTWVQCSNTACHKWRFLQDINDPTEIDDKWICDMNKDTSYNSCEKGEQDYDESDHIYTRYSEGSVVWARMVGYPWWPAMVEIDPDTETFFELVSENSMFPSHYHVVYLDNKVSRAWVKASAILPFHYGGEDLNKGLYLTKKSKGPNFKKEVEAARKNALAALELPVKERLKQFSFSARFIGKWAEEETKARKIKKHCRVKLTPKNSKKKVKKPKEHISQSNTEHQDLTMYMLDSSTVDEMLCDQPDSILKGIEDVLDSLGSQILSDNNDEDYLPTNTECQEFTKSTESRKNVSPLKKPKGTKRKNNSKEGEKSVAKKSKHQKLEGKTLENKKKKREKKSKDLAVNKPHKTTFSVGTLVELAENKVSKSDTCIKKEVSTEENLATSTATTMKFDSDIFTMELDDEECENIPKPKKKTKKCEASSPPTTPERKRKSNSITKPEKKKSKKNLFTVPETASNEKLTDDHSQNGSNKNITSEKSFDENVSSPAQDNNLIMTSETTHEKNPQKNDEKSSTDYDTKDIPKKLHKSPRKKTCSKKVSFSAPATVTMESKVIVTPVNNEIHLIPCNDEQTVPDVHTQESDEEDGFSLDLPVSDQKPEIQEVRITTVSTLPAAVDTVDAYDSDPFDLMEE